MKFSPWNERVILTAFAASQAIGLTYASVVAENGNPLLMAIAVIKGALLGLSVSFGLAVIAQKWGGTMTNRRRALVTVCGIALAVISPALIASAFLAPLWLFHSLCAVALDLSAVAIAATSGRLADEAKQSEPASEPKEKPAKKSETKAAKFRCNVPGCGWHSKPERGDEQRQYAGHMGKHYAKVEA